MGNSNDLIHKLLDDEGGMEGVDSENNSDFQKYAVSRVYIDSFELKLVNVNQGIAGMVFSAMRSVNFSEWLNGKWWIDEK
jgi:hypothetical protein